MTVNVQKQAFLECDKAAPLYEDESHNAK